jgi:hypothetical protein
VLAYHPVFGVSGWGWFLVFVGLLSNSSSMGDAAHRSRGRALRHGYRAAGRARVDLIVIVVLLGVLLTR